MANNAAISTRPSQGMPGRSETTQTQYPNQLQQTWKKFRRHKLAMSGLAAVVVIVLIAIFGPFFSPYDPETTNLINKTQPPSREHWLGTDELGRDLLTRLMYGGRVSIAIGIATMVVSITIGVTIGAIAGYYGGAIDNILMRIVDVLIALPRLFVLILISAITGGTSFIGLVLVLGLMSWMNSARLVRERYLVIREREYVEAARSIGADSRGIILRHILPNAFSPVVVAATLSVASAMISESSLSFLGLGISAAEMPTWGNALQFAQSYLRSAPWIAIFPGLCIFITVISVNFIGDGLRDALDPGKV